MDIASPTRNPNLDKLAQLTQDIDELLDTNPSLRCDAETIVFLQRQMDRFECLVTESVAAFDQTGGWGRCGAKTPAAWLSTRRHLPLPQARAQLRRGRALASLPLARAAWEKGDIGAAHIDALARVQSHTTEVSLARDEAFLVQLATDMKFSEFGAALSYWEQAADPDGAEESDMARQARRDVYLYPSFDGMYLGSMILDPISGSIVSKELKRIEDAFFEADWAQARAELGREPRVDQLPRTPGQRRADACVEMAIRSATMPANGRRPEPLFSVVIDYPSLHGRISQLSDGQVVSPGTLLPWMNGAYFERVVFAPGKRAEVSVTSRFFTGATRRAIELRDLRCTHEYCELPWERCQIDHIVTFGEGGLRPCSDNWSISLGK
jgi:hypothetical protein